MDNSDYNSDKLHKTYTNNNKITFIAVSLSKSMQFKLSLYCICLLDPIVEKQWILWPGYWLECIVDRPKPADERAGHKEDKQKKWDKERRARLVAHRMLHGCDEVRQSTDDIYQQQSNVCCTIHNSL